MNNKMKLFEPILANLAPIVKRLHVPVSDQKSYQWMAAKLVYILGTRFKDNLLAIKENSIDVLDLCCGIPIGFLALKALYPKVRINFIGIDFDAKANADVQRGFANFPECKIITADASQPEEILQAIQGNKVKSQGFSLIFLRQPNILDAKLGKTFKKILQEVIPFAAAKNAQVFISTYHKEEAQEVGGIITSKNFSGIYSVFPSGSTISIEGICPTQQQSNGRTVRLEPDSYAIFLNCQGLAFQNNAVSTIAATTRTNSNSSISVSQLPMWRASYSAQQNDALKSKLALIQPDDQVNDLDAAELDDLNAEDKSWWEKCPTVSCTLL